MSTSKAQLDVQPGSEAQADAALLLRQAVLRLAVGLLHGQRRSAAPLDGAARGSGGRVGQRISRCPHPSPHLSAAGAALCCCCCSNPGLRRTSV